MTIRSVDERIGARVKQVRVENRISVEMAANAAELSIDEYNTRESGDATFSAKELWALAKAFNVEFEDLFRGIIATRGEMAGKRH